MAEASGTISIDGDVSGLQRALADGKASMQEFEDKIKTSLEGMTSSISSLTDAANFLKVVLSGIGLYGIYEAGNALFTKLKGDIEAIGKMNSDAWKYNLTSEQIQEVGYASQRMGQTAEIAEAALKALALKLESLKDDSSDAAKSLEALNAPLLRQIQNAADAKEAYLVVAEAMRKLESAEDRVKLANELFGTSNAAVISSMEAGSSVIEQYIDEAHKAGIIMSGETTTAARQLTEALREQKREWSALIGEIEVGLLRNFADIIGGNLKAMTDDELQNALKNTNEQIGELERRLKEGAKAGDDAVGAWDDVKNAMRDVWEAFGKGWRGEKADLPPAPSPDMEGGWHGDKPPDELDARVQRKIEEMQKLRAEIEAIILQRGNRQADIEALDKNTGAEEEKVNQTLSAAQKFAEEMQKRAMRSSGDFYGSIAAERDHDLVQYQAYLDKLGDSWENSEQARLAIAKKYAAEMRNQWAHDIQPVTSVISGDLDKAFSNWIDKGKFSFRDLCNSMIADIAKVAMRMAILQPLFGGGQDKGGGLVGGLTEGLSGLFKSADGHAFDAGNVIPFAAGGIVDRPSIFAMRDGMGLMGEAGPEAVMPLRRGADGSLGVAAAGGGGNVTHVTFNVQTPDAESFRRSQGQLAAQLSRAVASGNRNR